MKSLVKTKNMKGKPSPIKSPVAQVTKCAAEKISNCDSSPDKELCFGDVPSDTSKDKSTPSISKSPSKAGNKAPMPTGQTDTICLHYQVNKCKHGSKGTNCKFLHPEKCLKFTQNGHFSDGCSFGSNCMLFHPKMCPHHWKIEPVFM